MAFLAFLLISSLSMAFAETQLSDSPTAYQMLEKFNFPRGILPEGVRSYQLRQDGSFEVYLSSDCEFKVSRKYLLRYKRKIAGKVQPGSLEELNGVSVKVLFLWIGIDKVERNGDELSFYVGPLSASFPTDNFDESPECRCGFDCAAAAAASSASLVREW